MIEVLQSMRRLSTANTIGRWLLRGFSNATSGFNEFLLRRWPVSGIVPVQIASMRFRLYAEADDGVASALYYGQQWEDKELKVWERLCGLSKTVIDVGAYNGVYSIVAAAANPQATIVAFEPHPTNAARLKKNLALNGVVSVRVEQQAVGSVSKTVQMTVPADDRMTDMASVTKGFARALHADHCHEIQVRQTTLDKTMKSMNLRRLDALKIDVEYYELDCLKGGRRSLKNFAPVILCEVFSPQALTKLSPSLKGVVHGDQVMKIDKLLSSFGYAKFCFGDQGLIKIGSMIEHPDERNFLFAKHSNADQFIPYSDLGALDRFLLKALAPASQTITRG